MAQGKQRIEAVALDAMGVIYPIADDLRDLLIPYLRFKGCEVPDEAIIEAFRACYRDGAPARSIWDVSGCDWQDGALERDYLACYALNPGVVKFLEAMRERSVPVYGLSNDVGEWARARLVTLGLEHYFDGWVLSSEVKAYKPQPPIYQHLVEMLPCRPHACLFVDDRPSNLAAAENVGLATVRFGSEAAGEFDVVPDFGALTEFVVSGQ